MRKQLGADHLDTKGSGDKAKEKETNEGDVQDHGKGSSSSDGTSWRDQSDWRARLDTGKNNGTPGKYTVKEGAMIPDLVPGIDDDIPLPSVEGADTPGWRKRAENASPEKSFAWQVDEDFTAGDLQVSDSPRIRMDNRPFANRLPFDESSNIDINSRTRVNNPGSRNTKLDEIRSREVKSGSNIPFEPSPSKARTTKLDEIREREVEVESKIPIPDRHLTTLRNTKLDDIKQREIDGLSKRQAAAARLEEIREKNSMPRSIAPDEKRVQSTRPVSIPVIVAKGVDTKPKSPVRASSYGTGGVRLPDTPVTIYKSRRELNGGSISTKDDRSDTPQKGAGTEGDARRPGVTSRRDSRDLLRQLARTTSSSPSVEPEPESRRSALSRRSEKGPLTDNSASASTRGPRRTLNTTAVGNQRRPNTRNPKEPESKQGKPTVGFVGLRRVRSTESTGSKRSSLYSEPDPTDRIEAEMKLFAPADNHSERGSVRGPSPAPELKDSDDDEGNMEATPRPRKDDPLSMPTPRVVGAYVETPAVEKMERFEVDLSSKVPFTVQKERDGGAGSEQSVRDTASDPGTGTDENIKVKKKRTLTTRRRAHSLPRIRPPLKNSAKLPSVKDDIKELKRMYDIEDSTIDDDFEDIIAGRKKPSPKLESLIREIPETADNDNDDSFDLKMEKALSEQPLPKSEGETMRDDDINTDETPGQSDLAAYERMSKSLATSLHGIRDAKKGMERLEDLTSKQHQTEKAGIPTKHTESHTHEHDHSVQCPDCTTHPNPKATTYVHLPVPRFYKTKPSFRLTPLGLIALLFSLWYAFESGMCAMYCSPTSCVSPPCVWSIDDPSFGTALPVKIDQWVTGGAGRVVYNRVAEEVEDLVADAVDTAYGRHITDIDTNLLSFEGKRAHRRRLRKKGLDNTTSHLNTAPPEIRARWDAWHRERVSQEKARDYREMGYNPPDDRDTTVGGDKRVW